MADLNTENQRKGVIAWMAGNSVAANLIMIICLVGGLIVGFQIKQEVFPDFNIDKINITAWITLLRGCLPGSRISLVAMTK